MDQIGQICRHLAVDTTHQNSLVFSRIRKQLELLILYIFFLIDTLDSVILSKLIILWADLGTNGSNLSHFWRANNLVKFRNFEKCSQIPKHHALRHLSMKLQLIMSSQRVDIIILPHPIFLHGCNLSNFGLFVLGSTRFLQFFLGYGSKSILY